MITSPAFAGKRYAVLGLARSGVAVVQALLASGASVTAWDSDEAKRDAILPLRSRGRGCADEIVFPRHDLGLPGASQSPHTEGGGGGEAPGDTPPPSLRDGPPPQAELGEDALTFADPLTLDLTGYAGVVVSPGVPLNRHPIAPHAASFGVPVIGDIELFAQARPSLPPHKVVGITGTNGKSTTTALIDHILRTAGWPSLMGGNIGLPILGRDPLPEGGVYVLELSSYQIDLTVSLDCDVAVLTNVTPDHLDRYDGFEAYAASKARLFAMQKTGVAVIATEDDTTRAIAAHLRHPGESRDQAASVELDPGFRRGDVHEVSSDRFLVGQASWPALQGPHNAQNAACAVTTCELLGLTPDQIEQGLRTYPGLPHRMERVGERKGVLFVNDSKATNATATAPALAAYPAIHWILGGLPKTDDLDDCAPHFGHVRAGYTIGQAGPMFARILRAAGKPVTESGTLGAAVRDAAAAARPGEVVMLSPACASFDQFTDYEARGEAFRRAVEAL